MVNRTDAECDEYVEEKMIEAEEAIEEALLAARDDETRAELVSNYRSVVGFLYRYYDDRGY